MTVELPFALVGLGAVSGFISGLIGIAIGPVLALPVILAGVVYLLSPPHFAVLAPLIACIGMSAGMAALIGKQLAASLTPARLQMGVLAVIGLALAHLASAHAGMLLPVQAAPQIAVATVPAWLSK